jgi:hypothetical protein
MRVDGWEEVSCVEHVELAVFADVVGVAQARAAAANNMNRKRLIKCKQPHLHQPRSPMAPPPHCSSSLQALDNGQGAGGCGALIASHPDASTWNVTVFSTPIGDESRACTD